MLWLASGIRIFDAASEIGVLDAVWLPIESRAITSGWVLAPPGLLKLSLYPVRSIRVELPGAREAWIPTRDGARAGYAGSVQIRIRPEAFRSAHSAAKGEGVRGVLLAAVRETRLPEGVRPAAILSPEERRTILESLSRGLAERGVALDEADLRGVDLLEAEPGADPADPSTRLLLVGLDGADWRIIDPLIAAGRMPHLARLVRQGVRADLLSITPMISPVVWSTIATGVEPTRHGILDFVVQDERGVRQPVTSLQRRAPAFWEILSRAELDCGVVGWWASWPADEVRGYLVSDRLAYQLFGYRSDPRDSEGKTWPPELYEDLARLIVDPASVDWARVRSYLGPGVDPSRLAAEETERLEGFRTLLASGDTYLAIALELGRRYRPRLEAVYFEGTDTVAHLFMPFRPPRLDGIDPALAPAYESVVDLYYETVDASLGQLLEGRDESWTVMIVSDHGFASDATRPRTRDSRIGHGGAADWHRRFGVLVLSGRFVRRGEILGESSVYDIAPTVLALFGEPVPRSWPGRVLGDALEPGFLEAYAVRYGDEQERISPSASPEDPAAAEALAKLQSLGYIGSDTGTEIATMTAHNNTGLSWMSQGRYAEAEREFRRGLEAAPRAPTLLVNLALSLRAQHRVEEAIELLEQALRNPGMLRMAGAQLAQIRLESGDLEGAESLARRVLAAEPGAAEVHNLLGLIREQRGDLRGAEGEFVTSAQLDPNMALARNNLGNLAKRRGEAGEAERWYKAALESDPYFMGAYNNLALVYQERGEVVRAIELYSRALAKAPGDAVVLNNLGSLHYSVGDREQARSLWKRSSDADPRYTSPLNNLAGLAIEDGDLVRAGELLDRALDLDPVYGDARINRSAVLRASGDVEGARRELLQATLDPRAAGLAFRELGLFELTRSDGAKAFEALSRALELRPEDLQVREGLARARSLVEAANGRQPR